MASVDAGDVITTMTVWSNDTVDALFHDGTVMSFGPHLDSFTVLRPNAGFESDSPFSDPRPPVKELFFTALALTKDVPKLAGVLEVYNRLMPQPKLLHALLPLGTSAQYWTSPIPIDSLLFRETVPSPDGALPQNTEILPSGAVRVHCECRMSTLTLQPTGDLVTVQWPAKVYDAEGSSIAFVPSSAGTKPFERPSSSNPQESIDTSRAAIALNMATRPTEKAHRFVKLAQLFTVDMIDDWATDPKWEALACWAPLLRHARRYLTRPSTPDTDHHEEGEEILHTLKLPSTVKPLDKSSCVANFPPLESHHASSLQASLRLSHGASEMASLHPPPMTVAVRFLTGHWAIRTSPHFSEITSTILLTDGSTLHVSPKHASPQNRELPSLFDCLHIASQSQEGIEDEVRFVYSTDLSIPLPTPAGYARSQLGPTSTLSGPVVTKTQPPSTGRYLPDTVAVCTSVAVCNHGRERVAELRKPTPFFPVCEAPVRTSTATALNDSSPNTRVPGGSPHHAKLIRCTSTVPGLGVFTALTDGTVKCTFDDRTIVILRCAPKAIMIMADGGWMRNDEETVAEIIDRTANRRCYRLSQLHPGSEFFSYVSAVTSFAKYASLPEVAREELAHEESTTLRTAPDYATQLALTDRSAALEVDVALARTRVLLQQQEQRQAY